MKWFLETEEKQSELVKSYGLKQEAQPYGTANIRIGLVDDEVRNTVQLMDEKPMVYCASARNENEEDPLDLRNKLNSYLDQARTRNMERGFVFTANETYKTNVIKLVYEANENQISCRVLIFRNKEKIVEKTIENQQEDFIERLVEFIENAVIK